MECFVCGTPVGRHGTMKGWKVYMGLPMILCPDCHVVYERVRKELRK